MRLEILEIGYFHEGRFIGFNKEDGNIYTCCVENMENWDKLYDHLTSVIAVEVIKHSEDNSVLWVKL